VQASEHYRDQPGILGVDDPFHKELSGEDLLSAL